MRKVFLLTALIAMMLVSFSGMALAATYSVSWQNSTSNLYQGQNKTIAFTITAINTTENVTATPNVTAFLNLNLASLNTNPINQTVVIPFNSSLAPTFTAFLNTTDETDVGPRSISLTVTTSSNSTETITSSQSFNVMFPYCDNISNMTRNPLRIDEIKNKNDIEDKDYKPLDSITVEVRVENLDNEDKQTAVLEAILVSGNNGDDSADIKEKLKINSDKTATIKFNITLPEDIEEGTHYLYIKVYNDDDDNNCEQDFIQIEVKQSKREILPKNIDFPSAITCGTSFTFSGRVANIGKEDEDKVRVVLKAFGNVYDDIFDSLDSGELSNDFSFDVAVPENASATSSAKMTLVSYFNYDSDNKVYDDESDTETYYTSVVCEQKKVDFRTETSTALVGSESEVRVLLLNPSQSQRTYSLSATADWASISAVTPSSLSLSPRGEQYISVKLSSNKDASVGVHNLNFKATYDGTTESVSVPVNLQQSSQASGVLDKIKFQYKSNPVWFTLNAGLVLAIIAVVVLLVSGRKA